MTGPPPGAPGPHPEHLDLLNEAIALLESTDLLTKDAIPVVKEALIPLDDLIIRLDNFDGYAYPGGFQGRLRNARLTLVGGEPGASLESLRSARADLQLYWEQKE